MYMYIYKYSRNEFPQDGAGIVEKQIGPRTRNCENDHGGMVGLGAIPA